MTYGLETEPYRVTSVRCPCCGNALEVILTRHEVDPDGPCECRLYLEGLGEGRRYHDALLRALEED